MFIIVTEWATNLTCTRLSPVRPVTHPNFHRARNPKLSLLGLVTSASHVTNCAASKVLMMRKVAKVAARAFSAFPGNWSSGNGQSPSPTPFEGLLTSGKARLQQGADGGLVKDHWNLVLRNHRADHLVGMSVQGVKLLVREPHGARRMKNPANPEFKGPRFVCFLLFSFKVQLKEAIQITWWGNSLLSTHRSLGNLLNSPWPNRQFDSTYGLANHGC